MLLRVAACLTFALCALAPERARAEIRYVNKAVVGGAHDGTSWTNAYVELRDALLVASGDAAITEIWVAAGVYTPTNNSSRLATFQLRNDLIVRGGFAGDETSILQRTPASHRSILSGDLGTPGVTSDNCHHVVSFLAVDDTAVLETFIITGGNADATAFDQRGGGILVTGSSTSPWIINCLVLGNTAFGNGGGAYVEDAVPVFVNCAFVGNTAFANGGGAATIRGAVPFINCTFANNTATGMGGGFFTTEHVGNNCYANPVLTNCILWGNVDSGPADITRQIDKDNFSCPPERPAFSARAVDPVRVTYSIIQNDNGAYGATNSALNPQFVDANGPDNVYGTPDDNVRLTQNSPAIDFGIDAALPADVVDLDADGDSGEAISRDADLQPRSDSAGPDAGAYEFPLDCNNNGTADATDIALGTSLDCNANDIPDECEGGMDCDSNGVLDTCEIAGHDCNSNGVLDVCDIAAGTAGDCDANAVPDACELAQRDCNANGAVDACDVTGGTSIDCNLNGTPDECEAGTGDCNTNGIDDSCDIAAGTSADCNASTVPDECELAGNDCNSNGVPDECDADCDNSGTPDECENYADCNGNQISDACDIQFGGRPDFNHNGVPDECDPDCNQNGYPDFIDLAFHLSADCNADLVPDDCQLAGNDCNANGVPDDCEGLIFGDADGSGVVDLGDHARMSACATGPQCDGAGCVTPAYGAGCCPSDLDGDGDVDLRDFGDWARLVP